ncbi:unnamed protein product, partial [Symbiodinium pilosum]
ASDVELLATTAPGGHKDMTASQDLPQAASLREDSSAEAENGLAAAKVSWENDTVTAVAAKNGGGSKGSPNRTADRETPEAFSDLTAELQ